MSPLKGNEKPLHYAIERNAKLVPDRPAVIWGDKRFTWREVGENVNRAANAFLSMGIKEGENIGIMLRNSSVKIDFFPLDKAQFTFVYVGRYSMCQCNTHNEKSPYC